MRILHTIHSVNPRGGGVIEGILRVSRHHQEQGHEVELLSLDQPDAPWVQECPVTTAALGVKASSYGYSPKLVPWLHQNARRFDAVVINGLWQYSSFGVWRALRRKTESGNAGNKKAESGKAEMLKKTRGIDNGSDFSVSASQRFSSRPTFPPYFVFPHGMLDPWFKRRYPLKHLKKWLYWPWAEYRVLRDARAVFFSNPTERELAKKSFWLYRCREAISGFGVSWPEGIEQTQLKSFLKAFPSLNGHKLFLFLSRIHEKKGPDLAIRAFGELQRTMPDKLENYRLVMAGPAASEEYLRELQRLEQQVCEPGTVCWTGMLPVDQKWGAMRSAEAFLLPSHQENYGLAVAEALSCRLPVLISKEVNVWQDVVGDEAGLAEPDNVEGTCRLIERWMDLPTERKTEMRQAAEKCFESRFEASRKAAEMIEIFHQHGVSW
jgi:glycosyltransferase involved in cell wall biosynthesis